MVGIALLGFFLAPASEGAPVRGKHYILLIDDSGDMHGLHSKMVEDVPAWVFRGPASNDAPRFDPALDMLSVLYFTVRGRGPADSCKQTRGDVISADTVLHLENFDAARLSDETSFRQALAESLSRPCRFDGHLSPIVTAQFLALPFVQQSLPSSALFSDVVVAIATNGRYNFATASPSAELERLEVDFPEYGVQVPEETKTIVQMVSSKFGFDSNPRWNAKRDNLKFHVLRAVPRGRPPDTALVYNRSIELDRVAVSRDRLFGIPKIPATGDIRIPRTELVPLTLFWALETGQGSRGSASSTRPPAGALDLAACMPPLCTSDSAGMRIDLFDAAVNPLEQSPNAAPFAGGAIGFRVGFRLDTKGLVYDHLYLESDLQRINLTAVPPERPWFLLFPMLIDNQRLASLWFPPDRAPPDRGLSHGEAVSRLQKANALAWFLVVAGLVALVARAANKARVYTFEPRIAWTPADEISIDLNSQGRSRLLVGSVQLRNGGTVGRLGRWLGAPEQPTRTAVIELGADPKTALTSAGFHLVGTLPLGFLNEQREMVSDVREVVSDGRQIHLFLAEETFADYRSASGVVPESVVSVAIPVKIRFQKADVAAPSFENLNGIVSFNVRILAETPLLPSVLYIPDNTQPLHYDKDKRLRVGAFEFVSNAKHHFALPFQGSYEIDARSEGRPFEGSPLALVSPAVTLDAFAQKDLPVELSCGDPEVKNPAPASHRYSFELRGPHQAEYEPADLAFDLKRDPARAEIILKLTYGAAPIEIYWNTTKKPAQWSSRAVDRTKRGDITVDDGRVVRFGTPFSYGFQTDTPTPIALGIEIGNSAKSGHGLVGVSLTAGLILTDEQAPRMHLREGWQLNDIVQLLNTRGGPLSEVSVPEGHEPIRVDLRLRPDPIELVDGGEIAAAHCRIYVDLAVMIKMDQGEVEHRTLRVEIPLHLEQLPGSNWLVIDFGTSAIAAAVGATGSRNDLALLDLQHLVVGGASISSLDVVGAERDTPFLPSWILCDADSRREPDDRGRRVPPGFPRHTGDKGASYDPGSPSFVTLPAMTQDLERKPELVILSLKSWLGKNAEYVKLPGGEVRAQDGDGRVHLMRALPLDDLFEASYAALAEAYLKQIGTLGARQVIVCHPNTFSDFHRQRLHRIVWKALSQPLGLVAPKHIQLLSESDAVAYWYCWNRLDGPPPSGMERVVVYDLGAGTLDVSVILIQWSADPIYPVFRERYHLGVPVAGNHFDEILARIIHDLLSTPAVLGSGQVRYGYPVVSSTSAGLEHDRAARWIWSSIRDAKHHWDGTKRFEVRIGEKLAKIGVADWDPNRPGAPLATSIDPGDPARVILRDNDLVLSIPADTIVSDPRIVEVLKFITEDVIDEALKKASARSADIDTVVVSGRAALWPGLADRVRKRFGRAEIKQLTASVETKAAVVKGAIARQDFTEQYDVETTKPFLGRMALIYGRAPGREYKFEDEWDRPIEIPTSTFRLVQVVIDDPKPAKDLAPGSLRRHFYIGIGKHEYLRKEIGRVLNLKRDETGGILITNEKGVEHRIGSHESVQNVRTSWPVGHPLLSPDDAE